MNTTTDDFLSILAYSYLRYDKTAEACTLLEALAILRPENAWVSSSLAYAYLLAGDHSRCLEQVERHTRMHATDPRMQLIQSRALWGQGRREEAQQLVQQISGTLRGAIDAG